MDIDAAKRVNRELDQFRLNNVSDKVATVSNISRNGIETQQSGSRRIQKIASTGTYKNGDKVLTKGDLVIFPQAGKTSTKRKDFIRSDSLNNSGLIIMGDSNWVDPTNNLSPEMLTRAEYIKLAYDFVESWCSYFGSKGSIYTLPFNDPRIWDDPDIGKSVQVLCENMQSDRDFNIIQCQPSEAEGFYLFPILFPNDAPTVSECQQIKDLSQKTGVLVYTEWASWGVGNGILFNRLGIDGYIVDEFTSGPIDIFLQTDAYEDLQISRGYRLASNAATKFRKVSGTIPEENIVFRLKPSVNHANDPMCLFFTSEEVNNFRLTV